MLQSPLQLGRLRLEALQGVGQGLWNLARPKGQQAGGSESQPANVMSSS